MFDEQPPKTAEAPDNVPREPADMFAGIKDASENDETTRLPNALASGLLRKKDTSMSVMPAIAQDSQIGVPSQSTGSSLVVKSMIVLLIIIVIGGGSFGVWWLYQTAQDKNTTPVIASKTESVSTPEPIEEPLPVVVSSPPIEPASSATVSSTTRSDNDSILFGSSIDVDKDGLDDVRERTIGTDPVKIDTDGDGLSDGDEVLVWRTDPLKIDTDGDSYPDGEEIKNGYNPLGRGKMIPTITTTTQAATATQ